MPRKIEGIQRTKNCEMCGTEFHWRNRHNRTEWERARFCSRKCVGRHQRGDVTKRFLSLISPEPNSGCWLWMGQHDYGFGHGRFLRHMAHRFAHRLFIGPIPDGLFVCHSCDVPACVNPDHLFLGTQADNVNDCVAKDRHPAGIRNPAAKINPAVVSEIRGLAGSVRQVDIAQRYGISQAQVSSIIRGASWRSVQ